MPDETEQEVPFTCEVCGRPVKAGETSLGVYPDSVNAAVLGAYMPIRGHTVCVKNVDDRVVIPNRMRLHTLTSEIESAKKALRENKRLLKKIQDKQGDARPGE